MDKEKMNQLFNELKAKYTVKNLISDKTQIIFILESPHIDELVHHSPVSGLSGVAMTKALFGKDNKTALGILVNKALSSTEESEFDNIGIMNICPIPMQLAAYTNEKVTSSYGTIDEGKYKHFFEVLEKVRSATKEKYKDAERNEIQSLILEYFRNSLSELKNRKLILVPCGNTAQTFFKLANVDSDNWTILMNVPHPSYGSWYKEKNKEVIDEIKKSVTFHHSKRVNA